MTNEKQPIENRLRQGYAGQEPRSKKIYVYWGVALALLLTAGLFCWLVVMPYLQVRAAILRYRASTGYMPGQARKQVKELGGPESAVTALALYIRLPQCVAPHSSDAMDMLAQCDAKGQAALLQLLNDDDPDIAADAAYQLGWSHNPQAVGPLIDILQDEHESGCLRAAAATALGWIGDQRALSSLAAQMDNPETEIRWSAVKAIGDIGGKEALCAKALVLMLGDKKEDARVRAAAAYALGRMGCRDAVDVLLSVLNDSEGRLRLDTLAALGQIGDVRAAAPLQALLQDENFDVRQAAAEALKKIRGEVKE